MIRLPTCFLSFYSIECACASLCVCVFVCVRVLCVCACGVYVCVSLPFTFDQNIHTHFYISLFLVRLLTEKKSSEILHRFNLVLDQSKIKAVIENSLNP